MSKARDLANAGTALTSVSATELGYVDGVTSAIQTQLDAKIAKTLTTTTGDTIYASGANTPARLGIGTAGQVLTVNAGATAPEWKTASSGSITWTQRKFQNDGYPYNSIAYNGSNLYVAVGGNGYLATSPDGITWTDRTSGFGTQYIWTVTYGNGLFVACGDNGIITTSTDGITWTARTSNMSTNRLWSVRYYNSLWVVVGYGGGTTNTGGLAYSSDGITWTRKSQSISVSQYYQDVAYNGTNWVITASSNGTNNMLYASTPSGTWTPIAFVGTGDNTKIFYDGTRTIVAYSDGYWYFTTSATMASPTKYLEAPSHSTLKRSTLYTSKIYLINTVYLQTFTPVSSANVALSTPVIVGTPPIDASSGITGTNAGIAVFAVGTFILGDSGQIYTSF